MTKILKQQDIVKRTSKVVDDKDVRSLHLSKEDAIVSTVQ